MSTIDRPYKFTTEFRQQVSSDLLVSLDRFEVIAETLFSYTSKTLIWQPPEKSPQLFAHYLDALLIIYINKYFVLCQSLIQALNAGNLLVYGLIGRSFIEHTAILRYYVTSKMIPLTTAALADGKVTEAEWQEIISCLDKHLTGQRFDWQSFFTDHLDKITPPHSRKNEPQSQVNIMTCLDKWINEKKNIGKLYGLFCDLVHPNLGSTLLISRLINNQISIGGDEGQPIGIVIINHTFAELLVLFLEVKEQLIQMRELKMFIHANS